MPLVLITGYPCSGKSYRASQLQEFFQQRIQQVKDTESSKLQVSIISDDSLNISRESYRTPQAEKEARATFLSAVRRVLGSREIVIADSLNYIKGYRYQLYCEAKAAHTSSCVVHIGTPTEICRETNVKKLQTARDGNSYADDVFNDLIYRYEEPDGMNRWDSPLFTILFDDSSPPSEQIWNALIEKNGVSKTARPNKATISKPLANPDYLYKLDKDTAEVVTKILDWTRDHPDLGGDIKIKEDLTITLPASTVTLPQLQRLRRQFVNINRSHPVAVDRVESQFVTYINEQLHV